MRNIANASGLAYLARQIKQNICCVALLTDVFACTVKYEHWTELFLYVFLLKYMGKSRIIEGWKILVLGICIAVVNP